MKNKVDLEEAYEEIMSQLEARGARSKDHEEQSMIAVGMVAVSAIHSMLVDIRRIADALEKSSS